MTQKGTLKLERAFYQSLTTPEVYHDDANILTELVLLNNDPLVETFPWRGQYRKFWSKNVILIKKLMRDFELTPDQLAFYIYHCSPLEISAKEFAKATIVPKKLFRKFNLQQLYDLYKNRREQAKEANLVTNYKVNTTKSKSLSDFIKELESGKI